MSSASTTASAQVPVYSSSMRATKYSELTRTTSDFFSREFPSGVIKVEARTLSRNMFAGRSGLKSDTFSDEFKVTAARDLATGAIAAEVKNTTHFTAPKSRIDCKSVTTLSSNNLVTQQLILSNPVLEGLKMDVTGVLQPSGTNNAKVLLELTQPAFAASTSVDLFRGPFLGADFATRMRDFQVGGEVGYDVATGMIDRYTAAIALDRPREKIVLQTFTGLRTYTASYFQKFNDQMEVAYRASWSNKIPNLAMEVGAKYYLIGGGFVKAKLDNAGRLGLAFAADLRPGMQLNLGAALDTNKLHENGHKFGLELNYTA